MAAGEPVGGMAVGLGARDTLRLEAAMPLYGHELSETINPIQAGLTFAVTLGDREFVGREALEKRGRRHQSAGPRRTSARRQAGATARVGRYIG